MNINLPNPFEPPQEFLDEIIQTTKEYNGKKLSYLRKDRAVGRLFEEHNFFWEEWMYEIIKDLYELSTDMIDVGAHIGTQTICMERVISEGNRVHSFEPLYHSILLRNVDLTKTCVYPYGVGKNFAKYSIMIHPWNPEVEINYGASTLNPNLCDPGRVSLYYGTYGPVEIPVVPLDFIQLERKVSIVKIDTEGMEEEVLESMKTLILRDKPVIIIEIWKHRIYEFFQTEIGRFIYDIYEIYTPNSNIFHQCRVCDEDYILIPRTRTKEKKEEYYNIFNINSMVQQKQNQSDDSHLEN